MGHISLWSALLMVTSGRISKYSGSSQNPCQTLLTTLVRDQAHKKRTDIRYRSAGQNRNVRMANKCLRNVGVRPQYKV
jgi:hypothetical protein